MRFQVPQFIEHEPKVVGPLTFRQFLYLAGPGAIAFFSYFTLPFSTFLIIAILMGMLGLALGFVKVGGKSLPALLSSFFLFSIAPKKYIWKKERTVIKPSQVQYKNPEVNLEESTKREIKLVQQSKIKDLATKIETNR